MKRRASQRILRLFAVMVMTVVMVAALATVGWAQNASSDADKECYLTGDMNADGVFDNQDAYHALFSFMLPDRYSIERDWDINRDQAMDQEDAIALLYAYMLPELYSEYAHVYEMVHDYFDPAWNWEETADGVAATVTVQCACGEPHVLTEEDGVTVTRGQTNAPSCTKTGSESYTAAVTFEGEHFTGSYSKVLPAKGHTAGESDYNDSEHFDLCANCGEKINVASHAWTADGEPSAATCKVQAVQRYICACGAEKQENLGYAEHDYVYLEGQDILVDGTCCQYAKQYQCSVCQKTEKTDYYNKHNYIAVITLEANCQNAGQKDYQCTACGTVDPDKKAAIALDPDKHVWSEGTETEGAIVYNCTVEGCEASKKTVTATQDGTVSKDALEQADELKLGNDTSVSLGQTVKDDLDVQSSVQIEVGEADKALVEELLGDKKDQIEGITVYDFSMTVDGTPVAQFADKITITMPYTLQPGEDADAIFVWFIDDNGELEEIAATYSDGFVTFQTDHFSYYTVTRLTPEERCAKFGHILTKVEQAATCTAAGYIKNVCQRCSYEENVDVLAATGHSYQETSKTAATCENFGVVVETCENCQHEKYTVERALGHNMQLSDSRKASCTEAGYEEYTCQNEDCSNTQKKTLAQLTHNYLKDESKTVAASCTAGGYDVYVCEHCQDEVKKNETVALGHDHSTDSAQWNDDLQNPAVTLSCSRSGCEATKVLKANVFVREASCLSGGVVEAIVSYNNQTFKKELSTDPALGHTPGEEWVVTENTHYLQCGTCGEKMDVATHNYDDGVVKEAPTCVSGGLKVYTCRVCKHTKEEKLEPTGKHTYDDGAVTKEPTCTTQGTKTYTCSVCNKTITENIPATGEHSYEGGKCVSCGKEQQLCNHETYTEVAVDVSAYDICPGFELYLLTCDCGEVQRYEIEGFTCDLKEETEEQAFSMKTTVSCAKCGLTAEFSEGMEFSADPCVARYVQSGKVAVNGQTVAEYRYSPKDYYEEHPTYQPGEKVEVKVDGFCGTTLEYRTCTCGEAYAVYTDDNCEWEYHQDYQVCKVCGAVCKYDVEQVKGENCLTTRKYTTYYYNSNNELIYSFDEVYISTIHEREVSQYELYGDSCEDGIKIWLVCKDCGEEEIAYYEGYHPTILSTQTDLTDANICASSFNQMVCACGKEARHTFSGEQCDWNWAGYNDKTGEEIYTCRNCHATMTVKITEGAKNEQCEHLDTVYSTYADADGNVIVTGYRTQRYTNHNFERSWELKGSSCEDGVLINETCVDCGYHNQYLGVEHEYVSAQEYDLEKYGICSGYVLVNSCACGYNSYSEIGNNCQWTVLENGVRLCMECGTEWETTRTVTELSQCQSRVVERNTLSYDGEVLLTFQNSGIQSHHSWVYEFELVGTSCEEGYSCIQTCKVCGDERRWSSAGSHVSYTVDSQLLTDTGLCGDVEIQTRQCPCGKNKGTSLRWVDQQCQFIMTDSQGDVRIYTCAVCNAERHRTRTEIPAENDPCLIEIRNDDSYFVKGEEIFRVNTTNYGERHDWVTEFELMGENCTDGVKITESCTRCDVSNSYVEYDHVRKEEYVDLAELGFCGGEGYLYACPCGEETDFNIYNIACNWQIVEESNGNGHSYLCSECGGTWVGTTTRGEDIDACHYRVNITNVFTPAGGDPVEFVSHETHENHDWVETYQLMGQLCTDGVQVSGTCTNCGESYNNRYTYHGTMKEEVYDLSEYGMCGGTLTVSVCYCEKTAQTRWNTDCKWSYVESGPGYDIEQCGQCKTLRKYTYQPGEKIGTCYRENIATYTFYTVENEAENVLLNVSYKTLNEHHRYLHTFELEEGATCEDFYRVNQTCADCDYTSRWGSSSMHATYAVSRETISENQLCGLVDQVTRRCACGEVTETTIEIIGQQCSFWYVGYDQELGCEKFACPNCGTERYNVTSRELVEGTTCEYLVTERTVYRKNGEDLFEVTNTRTQTIHTPITKTELLGENCDDGYIYREVCSVCDELIREDPNVRYGCSQMRVKRELLVPESVGLCGKLYWDTYSCACGKNTHEQRTWADGSCQIESVYDEETGEYLYNQCKVCGIREVTTRTEAPGQTSRCERIITSTVSFLREDELLFSYDRQTTGYSHTYVWEYHLNGDSCEDGYTYDQKCVWCDYVRVGEEVYYGHNTRVTEFEEIFPASEDICGEIALYVYSCACGEIVHQQVNYSCRWESVEGQPNCYRCADCGMTYENKDTTTRIPGTCQVIRILDRVYTAADGTVGKAYKEFAANEHITVYTVTGDCENGYLRTGYCAYCDVLTEQDEELRYGHDTFRTEYYDLQAHGMCGGYIQFSSCACGADGYWGQYNNCEYKDTDERNEDGMWVYHCDVCGTNHSNGSSYEQHPEECYADAKFYFKAVRDGEVVLHIDSSYRRIEHTFVAADYEGTCGGTIKAYLKCLFCDETETRGYSGGHPTLTMEYIYLKNAGCCGGYVEVVACPCGEYTYANRSFVCGPWKSNSESDYTEDGLQYGYYEETCETCGMIIREDWYDVPAEEDCHYERRSSVTITKNGAVLASYESRSNSTYHTYGETEYTLAEGATSCEEGVNCRRTCKVCGNVEQWTNNYHVSYVVERYDLAQMGSVCGGSFVHYACPCGYSEHGQFDSDCNCDMHGTSIDCWVEEAVEGGQETVDGWVYLNKYATMYVCAQTDPQCAFTVRRADCWLVENCVATEYQIWQLGYDAATDTCVKEIRIATGSQYTYHNYEQTRSSDDGDGDDTTYASKATYTCKDCQSTWVEENRYVDGTHVAYEVLVVNKLENFEERRYELTEYAIFEGMSLRTKFVRELKKADGTDESRVDTYAYDFTDGCKTTHTWSENGGEEQKEVVEHFGSHDNDYWATGSTCTQPGIMADAIYCPTCGQNFDQGEHTVDPYGHNWCGKADGDGYYCSRCLLENSNGADGTIVLEDMTEKYGNGENYVVGYWNRGEDIFLAEVSIVLADGTEILLDGIKITMLTIEADGINALSVSGSEVHEAAQAALETMEDYDVRVMLVPSDSSIAWDYAITMDGWTA